MTMKYFNLVEAEFCLMIQRETTFSIDSERIKPYLSSFVEPHNLVINVNTSRPRVTCVKAKTPKRR